MINKTKLTLAAAAIVAVGFASPAFAGCLESGAQESCGGPLAQTGYGAYAQVWSAPQPYYRHGLHAFARVPTDPPAFGSLGPGATGGGSVGYNENLKTDQW